VLQHRILKSELSKLIIILVLVVVIFKIVFYRESIGVTTRTALAVFWMMVLPGYALLYYWRDKLDFTERIVVGTAAAAGFIAITSYYFGLLGLHVKYQTVVLPVLMIALGILLKNFKMDRFRKQK